MKTQKGITLVALVITIIVMLILVGVTVTSALNGGLFNIAKKASSGTKLEAIKEELQSIIPFYIVEQDNKTLEEFLQEKLDYGVYGFSEKYTKDNSGYNYTSTNKYLFTYKEKNFEIDENLKWKEADTEFRIFKKATSITLGKEYIIVSANPKKEGEKVHYVLDKPNIAVDPLNMSNTFYEVNDGMITYDGDYAFKLNKESDGKYSFSVGDKYLNATNNTQDNYLTLGANDEYAKCTISFDENENAIIEFNGKTTHNFLKINNIVTSCYNETQAGSPICLYEYYEGTIQNRLITPKVQSEFTSNSFTLTWDKVKKADSYTVKINRSY